MVEHPAHERPVDGLPADDPQQIESDDHVRDQAQVAIRGDLPSANRTIEDVSDRTPGHLGLSTYIANVQLWQDVKNIKLWNLLRDNGFADNRYYVR